MAEHPTLSHEEFRASYEEVECRACGTMFNLGAQMYYDNLCPSCKYDHPQSEEKNL